MLLYRYHPVSAKDESTMFQCRLTLFTLFCLISFTSFSQDTSKKEPKKEKEQEESNESDNKRFGLIVGIGGNNSIYDIYKTPVIDFDSNYVRLDKEARFRGNFSLGLSYTFGPIEEKVGRFVRSSEDGYDLVLEERDFDGFSIAAFFNPLGIGDIGNSNISRPIDLGLGLGYRHGDFAIYGTVEGFSLNQPRPYFIDQYRSGDKQYLVNGQVQTSISPDDDRIFANQQFLAVGIKMTFTFSVYNKSVKRLKNADGANGTADTTN